MRLHKLVTTLIGVVMVLLIAVAPWQTHSGVPSLAHAQGALRQDDPVTLYTPEFIVGADTVGIPDPQTGGTTGLQNENLFLRLTDYDPETGNVAPELATRWTVSEDGRVWTFYLRDDVPWVRWNPASGEAEIVRMVTAGDVVFGIKRLCDPRLRGGPALDVIAGCAEMFRLSAHEITDADLDNIQVQALDDTTVEITLGQPAGFFLTLTGVFYFIPLPQDVIETHGDEWSQPGTLVTNGPYLLDRVVLGESYVLVRNPHLPADLQGPGNIERVEVTIVEEHDTPFAQYQANLLDQTGVPGSMVNVVLDDPQYENERYIEFVFSVHYLGFSYDKPPFDNVHVRRAFAAAVDRQRFVDELLSQSWLSPGIPVVHFTPPGMFGAPPLDEPGVGYNPDYAREQLALAGYPGCAGLPEIELVALEVLAHWGQFWVDSFTTTLGCAPDHVRLTLVPDYEVYMTLLSDPEDLPDDQRPHMWWLFWAPDYPDANNYVGDVLHCESGGSFRRPCSEIDDLLDQARAESDPATRTGLYYDISERFFGPEGEMPMIPLFFHGSVHLTKPWLTGPFLNDGVFGSMHLDWYTIDQEMQLAARGG